MHRRWGTRNIVGTMYGGIMCASKDPFFMAGLAALGLDFWLDLYPGDEGDAA